MDDQNPVVPPAPATDDGGVAPADPSAPAPAPADLPSVDVPAPEAPAPEVPAAPVEGLGDAPVAPAEDTTPPAPTV